MFYLIKKTIFEYKQKTMKQTLLFIFTFLAISVQAQLSYGPDDLSYTGPNNEVGYNAFKVINDTQETVNFFWTIERGDSPNPWEFSICDNNLCYAFGVETCPSSKVNILERSAVAEGFKVQLKPNGASGVAEVVMKLYSEADPNVVYLEIPMMFNIGTTSTIDINVEDITLYPNPTSDFFQIRNDDNVKHISLHSILGKRVFDMDHQTDKAYNISDLGRGIFMVRMYDKNGDVVKVLRLSKR